MFEEENLDNTEKQAVLVSMRSVSELKRAYPNYYLDTQEFLSFLAEALTDKPDVWPPKEDDMN